MNTRNSIFSIAKLIFYRHEYAQLLLSADNFNNNGSRILTTDLLLSAEIQHLMHYAQILRK